MVRLAQYDWPDAALAVNRCCFCIGMGAYGLEKFVHFNQYSSTFPDVLGVGSPGSLAVVAIAQGPLLLPVLIGYHSRVFILPALVSMLVAAFVVHVGEPSIMRERSLLYLAMGLVTVVGGDGALSLQGKARSAQSDAR